MNTRIFYRIVVVVSVALALIGLTMAALHTATAATQAAPAGEPLTAPPIQMVRSLLPAAAPLAASNGVTLSLSIAPSAPALAWGEFVTYTVVLRNTGSATAEGATLTNALPDGLTYISGTLQATSGSAEYRFTPRSIEWQGVLTPNLAVTLTYVAQLVTQDYIYNTAVLTHPLALNVARATSSPADEWGAPEVIAEGRVFDYRLASYRNIAVDSQCRPRIAYGGESGLYYATFANGAWTSARVPVTPTRPTKAALVLDPQDHALIAFYDDAWGYIWLAREISPTANTWSLERVSTKYFGSNFMEKVDIQLDSAGRLHLVYYDGDAPSGHYYTVYNGTTWLTPTLAVASSTCAFAVDGNDVPHLACKRSIYLSLYTYDGASWVYEDVAWGLDADKVIYAPGLAYDAATPHVTFLRPNNGLYHATKNPAWTITQVDVSPWDASHANTPLVTMAAVRGGRVAVAYAWHERRTGSSIYTETVRVAYRPLTGTTWLTESVDSVIGDSATQDWARPALALDTSGRAHLAYYYRTDAALRHAAQTNSFTLYTVDESLELGDNAALDVGSDASTHVAYVANGLRYAYSFSATTTWTKTLAVAGVHNAALLDLAVDGANTPHLVYQNPFDAPLYHATLNGGVWNVRLIDAPGVDANPALDADAAGTADVVYLAAEGANLAVRYGHFAAATWTTATLAIAGPDTWNHWQSPKLVAQSGKVYVLYADCTAYQATGDYPITLTLKTFADGAWRAQVLHAFTGQCNDRLTYHLLGDSAGRLAAVAVIADAQGDVQEFTFWSEEGDAAQAMAVSALAATSRAPQSILGYDLGRYRQVRGDGLETLYVSGGQKRAVYQDRSGATSAPVNLASTLDASTYLQDLACYGQNAAALERSYTRNALAVERTRLWPIPVVWANAVKSATPAAVYATEPITYTIRLEWGGNQYAGIRVKESFLLDPVEFIPGSLKCGAYINHCFYYPDRRELSIDGMFPPTEARLSTEVTFVVTPTCDIYTWSSPYVNTAQVDIGDYHFAPSARTALKAPFKLRASTPQFIPRQYFAPIHEALLYTVPKGDEPEALLKTCRFDVYTKLKVGSTAYNPKPMRNDGQNPDFFAGDWHHSQWEHLIDADPHILDLYVAAAGEPFAESYYADQLAINFTFPPIGPELAVLTDFQAMFNEWGYIGQHYPAQEQNAHLQDQNGNRILDFYDAVERIRQYADHEDGVVIDVVRDAYDEATRNTGFYPTIANSNFANRVAMGNQIDAMVARLPRTVKNVAILGNDAVVPYVRTGAVRPEARPATELLELPWNTTVADRQQRDFSQFGTQFSDIPYGTWGTSRTGNLRLQLGVGRVFRDKPLDLIALLDRMESPLQVGRNSRVWVLNTRELEQEDFYQEARKTTYRVLGHYFPRITELTFRPAQYSGTYGPGAYWLQGDRLLQPNNQRWDVADLRAVTNNGEMLLFFGKGTERGMTGGDSVPLITRPDFAGGRFGLALAQGNYAGLLPAGRDATAWGSAWFANGVLDANAALLAPTGRGARVYSIVAEWYSEKLFFDDMGYPILYRSFLDNLFYDWHQTVGQAQVYAHNEYLGKRSAFSTDAADATTLSTYLVNGLPTQRLQRGASQQATVMRLPDSLAAPAALQSEHTLNRTVTLAHFATITDTQGRVGFTIPHNGFLSGESYGPVLPMVQHTYILPAAATDINVTLTASQSHTLGPVTLIPITPLDDYGQPIPGGITLTHPYPANLLYYDVYTNANRIYLSVLLAAQQYDSATQQATLYDRLDYQITYQAPNTYTLPTILVNNGAPVNVDQAALPITVTFNAAQPFSGTLYWAIHDVAGALLDVSHTSLNVTAGAYQIGLTSDTLDWDPGPKQIVVFLAAEQDGEEIAVASAHTIFTVQGRSLSLAIDKCIYGAGDATASLAATVRDETGATVAGQSANLTARLDGAAQALAWQGNGVYTAALGLSSIVTGQHFISVTLGNRVAEAAFIIDRQPPTSTLSGPSVVATPTFTVTLGGGDDLSGVGEYRVQYRIGNGAWTDWLTRTTGWDYASGGPASFTFTFGPTQPVALQPGQTVYFRTRATDHAGNWEAEHGAPDLAVYYTTETPPISYTLTVTTTGNGHGVVTPTVGAHEYLSGTVVVVTATAQAGSVFDGWSGACIGISSPCQVTMNADKVLTATFRALTYTLAVNIVGQGAVTRVPSQTAYLYGAVVTLTATPDEGWYFGQWSGDADGALTQTHVTMNTDRVVTATFLSTPPTYYTLTMRMVGSGVITPAVGAHSYLAGSEVDLYATPAPGWQFDGWSGATLLLNPTRVVMNAHKTVTATFTLLANQAPNADAGNDQTVSPGAQVTLDGSASSDPDGDALTFFWRQTGGAAVSFTPTLSRTTFIAPGPSVLTFTLTVTDTGGLHDSDTVMVIVEHQRIYLPVVLRNKM